MQNTCRYCGKVGGDDDFYRQAKSRCKKCLNAVNNARYHSVYRAQLHAMRYAKDQARKNIPLEVLPTDAAYAAGLIDGEGCIRFTKHGSHGGTSARIGQITMMVEMVNTDENMILWIRGIFGGSFTRQAENVQGNRKATWHWRLTANQALRCLDVIYPYLKTKRRQAKLARRFQRYVQVTGRARTPKMDALLDRLGKIMTGFNKRGLR